MKSEQLKQRHLQKTKEMGQYWLFWMLDLQEKLWSSTWISKGTWFRRGSTKKGDQKVTAKTSGFPPARWSYDFLSSDVLSPEYQRKCRKYKWVLGKAPTVWTWKLHYLWYEHLASPGYLQFTRVPFRQCVCWWYSILQILTQYIGTYPEIFALAGFLGFFFQFKRVHNSTLI